MAHEGWRLSGRRVVALAMAALAFQTATACAPDVEGEGPKLEKPRKRRTADTTLPSDEADAGTPADPPRPACIPEKEAFVPTAVNPPAPVQTGACTAEQIDALAAACANDPGGADCTAAREQAPECAACIVSQSTEPTWKAFVIGPEGAHYNQAGCIEHATKVPGCGAEYTAIAGCISYYCDACETADRDACLDAVVRAECEPHLISAACGNAIQENGPALEVCFPPDTTPEGLTELFRRLASRQCGP